MKAPQKDLAAKIALIRRQRARKKIEEYNEQKKLEREYSL